MYGTVEQADAYVKAHYASKSAERVRWSALEDEDKTVYLAQAFDMIERLPFRGRKAVVGQENAFPRLPYQYGEDNPSVPECVISAETELALYLSDTKTQESSQKRKELIRDGVKSFSLGDLSENYGDAPRGLQAATVSNAYSCQACMQLLRPYLSGGFDICFPST